MPASHSTERCCHGYLEPCYRNSHATIGSVCVCRCLHVIVLCMCDRIALQVSLSLVMYVNVIASYGNVLFLDMHIKGQHEVLFAGQQHVLVMQSQNDVMRNVVTLITSEG